MNVGEYPQPCGCKLTVNTETNDWNCEWCFKHDGQPTLAVIGRQVIILATAKRQHRIRDNAQVKTPRFTPYTPFRKEALIPDREVRDWTV